MDFPNTLARHDVEGETNERGDATILVVDPWRLLECHEPRQAQIGNYYGPSGRLVIATNLGDMISGGFFQDCPIVAVILLGLILTVQLNSKPDRFDCLRNLRVRESIFG